MTLREENGRSKWSGMVTRRFSAGPTASSGFQVEGVTFETLGAILGGSLKAVSQEQGGANASPM